MRALQRKLLREVGQLRGQVAAIAMVMAGGIAMMVMALTNYNALSNARAMYYSEYRFPDVFAQAKRAPLPLLDAIRALPGVRDAEARVTGFVNLELEGFGEPMTGQIVSLSGPDDPGLNKLFLRQGRLPASDDEVVASESFAEAHRLVPGDSLVAILNGRRQVLRISGIGLSPEFIYEIRPGDIFPDHERFGVFWMTREPLARAFDLEGAFNDLAITLTPDARAADLIDALDPLLAPYGGVGAYDRPLQVSHRFLDEELKQLQVMTRMFTVIFLAVSGFLLNVVLSRLISSERNQIGILKAFGYSRWEVGLHYGQLALLMVGAGILPGLALGAWMGHSIANIYLEYYRFPFLDWSLQPSVVGLALLFALVTAVSGTVGGLRRAFKLAPAEAMRPESPAVFRPTLTERMGLGGLLDPAARMVLRNLERRPMRSAMSIIGIGLACGMLVMSHSQSGAIEEMIDVQFGFAQRDDLAVTFAEPATARAVHELAAIPGVRAVEPFRVAAVRLRNGHREYRTSLQGLSPDADLKRVLDANLQPAKLPAEGLLLTDYLADMLHVRAGDKLDVEFLEGRRRRVDVLVAGTVREYMGVGAYARQDSVNRLLGEEGVASGAWLAVTREARPEVLRALRERPRVSAVIDRAAMIQSFRDTMAESITTFTLISTLLAGSIAVGVVYNAARITLAERGRELASLRVLGYTRGEVRRLLLDELFVLSVVALPVGFGLGYGMTALLVRGFRSELYRVPLAVSPSGFAFAGLVVLAATMVSGWLVRRRLDRLDVVSVLKTKE